MFFAFCQVVHSFIQFFPETFGLIFGCLGILKGTLRYLLGLPKPFLEVCFLSGPIPLGNSGGGCTGKSVKKINILKLKVISTHYLRGCLSGVVLSYIDGQSKADSSRLAAEQKEQ